MEHAVAGSGNAAMMPVGYALGALKEVNLTGAAHRERVMRLLDYISAHIAEDSGVRDPGNRIRQLMTEIRCRVAEKSVQSHLP